VRVCVCVYLCLVGDVCVFVQVHIGALFVAISRELDRKRTRLLEMFRRFDNHPQTGESYAGGFTIPRTLQFNLFILNYDLHGQKQDANFGLAQF
jgi:hypothetical protein